MKPKLLFLAIVLFIATMGVIFSCSKTNDAATEDVSATSKFKSNEWPTFVISKDRLAQYFVGDNSGKTITVIIRSDINNPKNNMELEVFGVANFLTITQDEKYKTNLNAKLGIGNNKISLGQISAICRVNGKWIDNFEYLRFTPIESSKYSGYLAFVLSACDQDGKNLHSTIHNGRVQSEDESQPSPPAGTCADLGCPPGQHCTPEYKCVAN